jgi:hypothetical protein
VASSSSSTSSSASASCCRAAVVQREFSEIFAQLKNAVFRIPDRKAQALAGETDPVRIHRMLSDELRTVFDEFSSRLASLLPEWLTTPAWRSEREAASAVASRRAALAPEPELTVSQWADKNRRLSSKASAEPGQWQTARTPYLREIMDAMTPSHPCTDGDFMKGTQIGGSEAIYNAIGYIADQVPCPMMLVMPTTDTGKRVSKQRLQPMIDETPVLRRSSPRRSRATPRTRC